MIKRKKIRKINKKNELQIEMFKKKKIIEFTHKEFNKEQIIK